MSTSYHVSSSLAFQAMIGLITEAETWTSGSGELCRRAGVVQPHSDCRCSVLGEAGQEDGRGVVAGT